MNPPTDCQACRLGILTVPCPVRDEGEHPCLICNGEGTRLHRRSVVQMEGPVPNPLLLLGEAPGFHEDLEGLPFRPHAPAGRVLRRALDELGLTPALDNIVHCRPPDNKLKNYPDAIVKCLELYLSKCLAICSPKVIVTLGALAGQTWFPGMKATEMSQTARVCVIDGRQYIIVGSLHPSYVARGTDPSAYGSMIASLKRAARLVKESL